jgi:hypothetical protein
MSAAPKLRAHVSIRPEVIERAKKRIEKRAREFEPQRASVGIHATEGAEKKLEYDHSEGDATLAEVAAAHEFGIGVPNRSWLRSWFDQNRSRLIHEMVAAARAEYGGEHDAIERWAEAKASELAEWIEQEDAHLAALSPRTVAEKRSHDLAQPETPLVATHQLVAAIKSLVEKESKE